WPSPLLIVPRPSSYAVKCAPGIGPVPSSILDVQERPPMPKRRRQSSTPQFEAQVLLEVLSGQRSASESARQHKLKPETHLPLGGHRPRRSGGPLPAATIRSVWLISHTSGFGRSSFT